jgi:hypothetical protein
MSERPDLKLLTVPKTPLPARLQVPQFPHSKLAKSSVQQSHGFEAQETRA